MWNFKNIFFVKYNIWQLSDFKEEYNFETKMFKYYRAQDGDRVEEIHDFNTGFKKKRFFPTHIGIVIKLTFDRTKLCS